MKKNWLIIKGNRVYYQDEVYGFTIYDFLFSKWKIKGKNPIIIEGDCVVKMNYHIIGSHTIETEKKKIKIFNPIIEMEENISSKEGGKK